MQDNSNQTQPQSGVPTGFPQNMPQNVMGDLTGSSGPATPAPAPVVTPIVPEAPVSTLDAQVAQMPTENLNIDSAAKPIIPPTTPVVPTDKSKDVPVEELPPLVTQPEMTAPVVEQPFVSTQAEVGADSLNVSDMMETKPVEQAEKVEQIPTAPISEVSSTSKAENLNILSDIIPTPMVETSSAPVVKEEPKAPAGPVSIAPEGELSQVFQLTPSEVVIPENTTPEIKGPEPAMVSLDSVNTTPIASETATVVANQVPVQAQNQQKSGRSGGVLRYIVWIFILLLGVVAVVIGTYLANLIDIPFLDTIFGR